VSGQVLTAPEPDGGIPENGMQQYGLPGGRRITRVHRAPPDKSGPGGAGGGAPRVDAPLGNNANNVSARDAADARRSVLYRLRETARPLHVNRNARKCGRVPHGSRVEIRLRVEDGKAHYHGLTRCGCWHSCPVCGWQIAMHRAAEVRAIADAHRAAGGAVYLVTFTLPHDLGDRLRPLYIATVDSYRYSHSGTPWLRMKKRISYVGEIRALEATVGANGWHPHLHVLLFTSRALTAVELDELHGYLYCRWSERIVRYGCRAPSSEHGISIVESRRDDYLTKMGLGDELAKGIGKDGEGDSRTPLQVLADLERTGDVADLVLWQEWGEAMHGARQLTWSRGLRQRYAADPERTDAEIVAGESDGAEDEVATIAPDTWYALLAGNADIMWRLLDAAESGGGQAVEALIVQTLVARRRRAA